MADHTENSLGAVITSLRTIVSPAVDAGDPLAQQQLQLVIAYLSFLRSRLPNLPDRDRFEVRHHVRLAESALEVLGGATEGFVAAVADGKRIAATPGATHAELHRITAILAARVSELIESDLDDDTRHRLERAVLDASAERVEFDRAWYQPMGFDPHPESVPSLDRLLP